jgi:hypothetical protein
LDRSRDRRLIDRHRQGTHPRRGDPGPEVAGRITWRQADIRSWPAYIRFANDLDARRLRAARQGQASYDREIQAEMKSAVNDPRIAARTAAGFNDSCNAR